MGDGLRFGLTMLIAPAVAFGMWTVARFLGRWIADSLPAGPIKDALTKHRDYGGY